MFPQPCVKNSVRGGVCQTSPWQADTPLVGRHPPWQADTLLGRHPSPWQADTPLAGRHPPCRQTLPCSRQTPSCGRQTPPWADTPSQQMATAADGTHPTGMHSYFLRESVTTSALERKGCPLSCLDF